MRSCPSSSELARGICSTLVAVAVFASRASAQDSDYCRRVRARAASDASLLVSPQLVLQAMHVPANGFVDSSGITANGYQTRLGLAFSPLDAVRSRRVRLIGTADCDHHLVATRVEELLLHGTAAARLAALRERAAFLEARREEWRGFLERARQRLDSQLITLVQFNDFRRQVDALETMLSEVHAELATLEADAAGLAAESVAPLIVAYADEAEALEREQWRLRRLDAWETRVTGGVVGTSAGADWFGIANVTFNFGAFARRVREREYLSARSDEIRNAPYEIVARLRQFLDRSRATIEESLREVEACDQQIAFITRTRELLEGSDAQGGIAHARDSLALELFLVESRRVFLRGLATSYSAYLGGNDGR